MPASELLLLPAWESHMEAVWKMLLVLPLACLAGCLSFRGAATAPLPAADPFLAELARQPALKKMQGSAILKPDVVFQEIPVHTPLKDARAQMERHGFSCW